MGARLFFATATAGRYDVYLLDEVLAVGDQHFQSKCWRRLRDRVANGASGVLVTHDWSAIIKLCQTAHVIDRGRVVYTGPAERAARQYLYGEAARSTYHEGVANFANAPRYPQELPQGGDLKITVEIDILKPAKVGCVMVIERLQPSFGWEISLMSRTVAAIGETPGRYEVTALVPALPTEPGSYQISLHAVMPHPDQPGQRIALDGYGWLDGTGLALEVTDRGLQGLMLPALWKIAS